MLFDRIVLRNSRLNLFEKVRKPVTIGTYLKSLRRFYGFVLCGKPKTVNVTTDDCYGMKTSVSNCFSSYKRKLNVRKFEKQADDLAQIFTIDELHKLDEANVVEDCKFNLKKSRLVNKP